MQPPFQHWLLLPNGCWRLPLSPAVLQTVSNVLAECGQDIDAAIRRLTQLRIDTAQQQQQQPQQQQAAVNDQAAGGQAAAGSASAAAAGSKAPGQAGAGPSTSAAAPQGPQTAEEWVDALVQEMSAAKDLPDARLRGSKLLHAFEQFTSARVKVGRGGGRRGMQEAACNCCKGTCRRQLQQPAQCMRA